MASFMLATNISKFLLIDHNESCINYLSTFDSLNTSARVLLHHLLHQKMGYFLF